jgi:hypothetical protein
MWQNINILLIKLKINWSLDWKNNNQEHYLQVLHIELIVGKIENTNSIQIILLFQMVWYYNING